MVHALIILADGFEEIEAMAVIDILRRSNVSVTVAGLNSLYVIGSHHVTVKADVTIEDALNKEYTALILPGGEPGTTNLENSEVIKETIQKFNSEKKLIAAICAAPRILSQMDILNDKKATSYPSVKAKMMNCHYIEKDVVRDDNIITSRGPSTAMAFAFEIVSYLQSSDEANKLKKEMVYIKD